MRLVQHRAGGECAVDLLELDDMRPVVEDPALSSVDLGGGAGEQFAGVVESELASAEPVDQTTNVGGRGGEQVFEFVAAPVELASAGSDREDGFEACAGREPDPCLSEVQVQPVPVVGVAGWSWADARDRVGDLVGEAVAGDLGDGVVPHAVTDDT